MIQAFISDFSIGLMAIGLAILLLSLWVRRQTNCTYQLPSFENSPPAPEPDIINKPKTTGMVHIKFNKKMEYVISIKAGNHETLQHSEGLQSELAVKKHLAALAKATNSPGLAVKDHTGHFPELETA